MLSESPFWNKYNMYRAEQITLVRRISTSSSEGYCRYTEFVSIYLLTLDKYQQVKYSIWVWCECLYATSEPLEIWMVIAISNESYRTSNRRVPRNILLRRIVVVFPFDHNHKTVTISKSVWCNCLDNESIILLDLIRIPLWWWDKKFNIWNENWAL